MYSCSLGAVRVNTHTHTVQCSSGHKTNCLCKWTQVGMNLQVQQQSPRFLSSCSQLKTLKQDFFFPFLASLDKEWKLWKPYQAGRFLKAGDFICLLADIFTNNAGGLLQNRKPSLATLFKYSISQSNGRNLRLLGKHLRKLRNYIVGISETADQLGFIISKLYRNGLK